MPTAALNPSPEEVVALCGLGQRARVIVDGFARDLLLASDPDATVAATLGCRTADVTAVLERFARWGWLKQVPEGGRILDVGEAALLALSNRLRGMLEARMLAEREAPKVVPIVTLPETSDALRRALGDAVGNCFRTRDGFTHVAARAKTRIVFLMPFMDATGAEAVVEMLERCAAPEKVVILRPDSRGLRHHVRFAAQLEQAGATVREYWFPRGGREGPVAETFHAKLVMADRRLVYVGSSNLMASSLDGGLECGVLLDGQHARPFHRIVEAVLAVSSPLRESETLLGRGCA